MNLSEIYNPSFSYRPNFDLKLVIMKVSLFSIIMVLTVSVYGQSEIQKSERMKLNAGIITDKISETKKFYTEVLDFGVTFENEFYLLMHTPNHQAELSFLEPNHPTQKTIFQPPFDGRGVYLTIEVEDVDRVYEEIKNKGVNIEVEIRNEPWGDRHFAILDPNGIGIDIVKYSAPDKEK